MKLNFGRSTWDTRHLSRFAHASQCGSSIEKELKAKFFLHSILIFPFFPSRSKSFSLGLQHSCCHHVLLWQQGMLSNEYPAILDSLVRTSQTVWLMGFFYEWELTLSPHFIMIFVVRQRKMWTFKYSGRTVSLLWAHYLFLKLLLAVLSN